jgi:hypothetical protein
MKWWASSKPDFEQMAHFAESALRGATHFTTLTPVQQMNAHLVCKHLYDILAKEKHFPSM